jgi:predicted nucleotide-binding protein
VSEVANDLLELAGQFDALKNRYEGHPGFGQIEALRAAAEQVGRAHSGSWLGYHSKVYHESLQLPPAGSRFSVEWGFESAFSNPTTGDWREFSYAEIEAAVLQVSRAQIPLEIADLAEEVGKELDSKRDDLTSIISTLKTIKDDPYLDAKIKEFENIKLLDQDDYIKAVRPTGSFASRDSTALMAGLHIPPHVSMIAYSVQFSSLSYVMNEFSGICRGLAKHLQRKERSGMKSATEGTKIFLGHGRSAAWRDLKDFLSDRLHLEYDEFNRVSVAGVATSVRLQQMLENARFAFIIMTAEDETAEGKVQARMNVIHEAGLFQGRLGLERAIILLEEGCEEFSNIQGLGQIRFPAGNISAKFEDIRMVLEREGML